MTAARRPREQQAQRPWSPARPPPARRGGAALAALDTLKIRSVPPFSAWAPPRWRHYQQLALDAFEADLAAGRDRTLIVSPPGSGKTLVGLEVARRLGAPALVLCPSRTIAAQWTARQNSFGPPDPALQVFTYQSLCQADDPGELLARAAEAQWLSERARLTGRPESEIAREVAGWQGSALVRREREVATIIASLKRAAARGRLDGVDAAQLLSDPARARLGALRAAGTTTVVLDECHHLASLWGSLIVHVLDALDARHVVGLTATYPDDLTPGEQELYELLLGEVDFEVATPAVVREGHLAPYQELVQLCTPLVSEREWLDARHERFAEMLAELDDPASAPQELGLSVWLTLRLQERRTESGEQLAWREFARRAPRFADAGLRWLHARGVQPPAGAPRGEAQRARMDIDDWVALLDDYAARCLRPHPSATATERLATLQAALGELGYTVTRQGIRRTGGDVDRVLLHSAAKPLAMCDALAVEHDVRGDALRALVLCDSAAAPGRADNSPLALSGGGLGLLAAIVADERLRTLRPALITAEVFAIRRDELEWWGEALAALAAAEDIALAPDGFSVDGNGDIGRLRHRAAAFDSRVWTRWATALVVRGECRTLIGTRGLLGEGWDCPPVNVLLDLTAVAANVSVRQMRGRSLRLDPAQPAKLSNHWDVVCVAPDLSRGVADYARFVRRHHHLHAPCEDGVIERGTSHVHPDLSPYAPPQAEEFAQINAEQRDRARDLDDARRRWRIGTPYDGLEREVVVARRREPGIPLPAAEAEALHPPRRWPLPRGFAARTRWYPPALPLHWAGNIVREAYVALGELESRQALEFAPRPDGWIRLSLPGAAPETSAQVAGAVDELLTGLDTSPRYVVSRRVVESRWSRPRVAWHAVPSDLARRKDRAEAFAASWAHWCGKSALVYFRQATADQLAVVDAGGFETLRRTLWE